MTKKLLGTTALMAVSFVAAQEVSAAAVAPALSISGNARFQAMGVKNSAKGSSAADGDAAANPRNGVGSYGFTQTGEMRFAVAGMAKNGLEYNYLIALSGNTGSSTSVSENRIEFKGSWGALQLGDTIGAQDLMMVDAVNVIGGTGGFDGSWLDAFTQPAGVFAGDSMVGDPGDATKMSYFTPRVAGFQFGLSFTPSSRHEGAEPLTQSADTSSTVSNVITRKNFGGALNYTHAFDEVGVSATGAFLSGDSKASTEENAAKVRAYQIGGLVTYRDFQFGAGYIDNKKSTLVDSLRSLGTDAGKAWSFALGYTYEASKFTVGYQQSKTKVATGASDAKGKFWSFTADHTLAPGLGVYAEADFIRFTVPQAATGGDASVNGGTAVFASGASSAPVPTALGTPGKKSNTGSVFILGTKISF
ncbi:MAG: porin [Alphaproteobacteria bacterium]|jgi:outer membrane protein OmpU|nr:porin [Alphaproteobacteria bacterium]MBT5390359.1 porin [Alphaproteobacteria bacterium]MBT5540952.1 porin [Alphaproteobacteria bacterium]MBT5654491.1 porin [Alphaproteobacteria bacterium]